MTDPTPPKLNSTERFGISFVNRSLIALMSPSQRKKCSIPKMCHYFERKRGKDRTLIENRRPISPVDVDAEIIS